MGAVIEAYIGFYTPSLILALQNTIFRGQPLQEPIAREKRVEMGSTLPSVLLECREPLLGSSRSDDGRPTEQRFVDAGQLRSHDGPPVARARRHTRPCHVGGA